MANKEKLLKGGKLIYPATVTDAVVNPTNRKNLTQELKELSDSDKTLGDKITELLGKGKVVDVVASKAELDSYDISKIVTKDVIIVLRDESKKNENTYYRLISTSPKTWDFVGSSGDVYTKEEVDALLNPMKEEIKKNASDINRVEGTINAKCKLPKWFMDSLVCWYNPSRQGLKNGIDIKAGEPFIMKDFSPNHLDMTMHGFAGEGMSGMNGYAIPLTSINIKHDRADVVSGFYSYHITSIKAHGQCIVVTIPPKKKVEFKFKVFGLSSGQTLETPNIHVINSDGIYDFIYENTSDTTFYKGFSFSKIGDYSVTIDVLPLYEGALVFDGVDDYGISENQPILTDYTVMAKRRWLSHKENTSAIAGKRVSESEQGAFQLERDGGNITLSFGKFTPITLSKKDFFVYQTKGSYNGNEIAIGNATDSKNLFLGKSFPGGELANFALYDFILFNRTLTIDEIEWVKKNVMEDDNLKKNGAIETKDGKVYINGVGGFDGTNAEGSNDVAKVVNELSKQQIIQAEYLGAVRNPQTGLWAYNGLDDITDEEIPKMLCYPLTSADIMANDMEQTYAQAEIRTNFVKNGYLYGADPNREFIRGGKQFAMKSKIEVLRLPVQGNNFISFGGNRTFQEATNMRKIIGKFSIRESPTYYYTFYMCKSLEEFELYKQKTSISFSDSPNITKATVEFAINNAERSDNGWTFTLHPTAFARLDPAFVTKALSEKNITIKSA